MTTENAATNGGSSDPLAKLSAAGVSIWLDDLSRERLETGNLAELIKQRHVVGVTTNPTIFASALANGERYDEQLRSLVSSGASVEDIITELTTDDVRNACDVFMDTFEATGGQDGRVSIEVEPGLAFDCDGTLAAARMLYKKVDRPNLLIKIPATTESLPAITATIADGISVNVTLIFGLDRYGEVMNAYLEGLEKAKENGEDLSKIQSVASFFVSRVDSEIDKQLEKIGTDKALSLRGKAAIANARLAFERYEDVFCDRERWKALKAAGANPQRPLWASTGVKNPDYSDTMYVTELVARGIVNTMPEKTLEAVADHGEIAGDTIHEHYHGARHVMSDLEILGIDYDGVIATLEQEGVDKFVKSWGELVETVEGQIERARSGDQG
jgi:transaldolase